LKLVSGISFENRSFITWSFHSSTLLNICEVKVDYKNTFKIIKMKQLSFYLQDVIESTPFVLVHL